MYTFSMVSDLLCSSGTLGVESFGSVHIPEGAVVVRVMYELEQYLL